MDRMWLYFVLLLLAFFVLSRLRSSPDRNSCIFCTPNVSMIYHHSDATVCLQMKSSEHFLHGIRNGRAVDSKKNQRWLMFRVNCDHTFLLERRLRPLL